MKPIVKNILKYFSYKEVTIVLLAIVFAVTAGVTLFINMKRDVVVYVDGEPTAIKTMKSTVSAVLSQNNIEVGQYDYISQPLNTKLQRMNKNEIYIKRAFPVYIQVDGNETMVMTYRDNIGETLDDAKIAINSTDRIEGVDLTGKLEKDSKVKIVRVTEQEVTEYSGIPFETIRKENTRMDMGKENVVAVGQEGKKENKFLVTLEDGVQTAKKLVSESVVANPIDQIIEFGTVLNHKTARGDVVRYKNVLDMRAAAYSLTLEQTGKTPGQYGYAITASGMRAQKGVIAVDPRVIPLGTKLYVEVAGNYPDYGFCVAGDTGSAIKGDLIDLFYDEYSTAAGFGVRRVKVYILQD